MDPIIRAAAVSSVPRQLRRGPAPAAAAPAAASVGPAIPVPARAPTPAPFVPTANLLAAREATPDTAPAPTADSVLLAERDAEIARLRAEIRSAKDALADSFANAERRGLESGEKKGLDQGERHARAQLGGQIERVQAVLAQASQARRTLMDEAEDALVEIAFAAVCRILGEQGATRAGLERAVRETMAAMRARDQLVVRLHPDDAVLFGDAAQQGDVRFSADPSIALGGCQIDSPGGSLDARFETQLEALAAALAAVRAERRAGQEAL